MQKIAVLSAIRCVCDFFKDSFLLYFFSFERNILNNIYSAGGFTLVSVFKLRARSISIICARSLTKTRQMVNAIQIRITINYYIFLYTFYKMNFLLSFLCHVDLLCSDTLLSVFINTYISRQLMIGYSHDGIEVKGMISPNICAVYNMVPLKKARISFKFQTNVSMEVFITYLRLNISILEYVRMICSYSK
jgi:hypothetical protein